ncbi:MAG: hypothetical protein U0T58_00210 [Buchnera aphidicola (Meitanaphis elongallis)]
MSNIVIPTYSHFFYDIIPYSKKVIERSDIFIIEGLHILCPFLYQRQENDRLFLSNIFNFLIYLDAHELLLREWYLNRFLKLRYISQFYPSSFFNIYSKMSYREAVNIADNIWYNINYVNLKKNILPTKKYANFVLTKNFNHNINSIQLMRKDNIRYH